MNRANCIISLLVGYTIHVLMPVDNGLNKRLID